VNATIITAEGCLGCEDATKRLTAAGYKVTQIDRNADEAKVLLAGLMAIIAYNNDGGGEPPETTYPLIFIEGGLKEGL